MNLKKRIKKELLKEAPVSPGHHVWNQCSGTWPFSEPTNSSEVFFIENGDITWNGYNGPGSSAQYQWDSWSNSGVIRQIINNPPSAGEALELEIDGIPQGCYEYAGTQSSGWWPRFFPSTTQSDGTELPVGVIHSQVFSSCHQCDFGATDPAPPTPPEGQWAGEYELEVDDPINIPPKEPVLWDGGKHDHGGGGGTHKKKKRLKQKIKEELENYDDTVTQVQFQDELIQLSSQERDMVRDILEDSLGEKRELEEVFDYKGIPELKAKGFFGKMMKYFKRLFTDKATSFLINASATETKDTIELIKVMDPNDMTGVFDPRAIYLGGAIDFATDALGWRTKMEEYFGESHVVKDERMAKLVLTGEWDTKGINTPAILNPMRAETVREEDEEFTDLFGKWKKDSLTDDEMQGFREKIRQNIILQDLRMLDICDTNLVRYDGKAGAGTLGEAQISALKNQQIFLWITDGMKISNVSPWLLPAVTKICIDDEIWELLKHFR